MSDLEQADTAIQRLIDAYAAAVGPLIAPGEDFALVDFPDHFNVGDSAIYAGEMVHFDQHVGRSPSYVCTVDSYRQDLDQFCPEGPIFMHGGGNFGDVWPVHQRFRYEILERYKGRRVIQMGQSLHFREEAEIARTARAIDAHGDFTLLVRDHESFEFANKHFDCAVVMCPDAAHNMWKLKAEPARAPILSMVRADRERRDDSVVPYLESLGEVTDWQRQFWARSPMDRVIERGIAPRMTQNSWLMRRREKMYRRQVWNRINYGTKLLSQGELVISDRLHVHIMSSLMRKSHISLDNYYGKIARYIAAWGDDGLTTQVDGLEALKDAVAQAGHG